MDNRKERKIIAHFRNPETYRKLQRYRPADRQILLEKGVEELLRTKTFDEIDKMLEAGKIFYTTGRPKGVTNRSNRPPEKSGQAEKSSSADSKQGRLTVVPASRVKGFAPERPFAPPAEKAGKDDLGLSNLD
jgi:hypothetical protein